MDPITLVGLTLFAVALINASEQVLVRLIESLGAVRRAWRRMKNNK